MQVGQDGKYFKLYDDISAKSGTTESPSGHFPPIPVENRIHRQVDDAENVANGTNKLFIKRRPSETSNQNEPLPVSPTRKSLRKDSAWSSEPALTLRVPQLAENQLHNQYDAVNSESVLLSRIIAGQLGRTELTEDEKRVMKSKKFQIWRAFCHFFTITSFHGLPHIAASRSSIRICYWIFLILISLGLMLWAIIFVSVKYFDFNTFIKTELEEPNQLRFPAVTICNLNQFTRSNFERVFNYSEEEIFIGTLFNDFISSRRILTKNFNFSELNTSIAELAQQYSDDFIAASTQGLHTFSHKLENMLVSCYYNDQPCFNSHFVPSININGRCFTFNGNTSDVLYATTPGSSYGLELVLNVEQYEYFLSGTDSVGFKVYVHQQGDFPYMGEHPGFTISPGMHTDIVLSTEQLEYLEPPYGECYKDLKLEYFSVYTREACLDECRTKVAVKECGCRLFFMPGNARTCLVTDFANCVAPLLQNFWDHHYCDCPLPCSIPNSYQYALSYSGYPAKHFPLLLHKAGLLANMAGIPDYIRNLNATKNVTAQNEMFNFFKENLAKTTFYYNQLSRTKVTEVAEYEAFQFIADFGGHLGLFTGAGFLTFFEFVEVCLGIIYPAAIDNDHHGV